MTETSPRSNVVSRWGAPLGVCGLGAGLSLWVLFGVSQWTLPPGLRPLALSLLPAVGLIVVVGVRATARESGRHGDLIVTWLTAFLMALHGLLLGVGIGMDVDLAVVVPMLTGLMFAGLGAALTALEPGSALGIRVAATLADAGVWRRAHRLFGLSVLAAGLVAVAVAPMSATVAMAALTLVPAAGLIAAIGRARRLARARDEDSGPDPRPTDAA